MSKTKKNNVTIKDIALQANVSLSTVSRVINNSAGVSSEKKARVFETIEKYNYHPNLLARSLKNDSTQTIAMLISDGNNEHFGEITKSIESIIRPCNYNLFYCNTLSEKETETNYLRLMKERQVDGLIINSTGFNDEYIAEISQNIPTVLLHRRNTSPNFIGDFIDSDFGSVSYDLCCHLIANGHREIGIICGPSYLSSHNDRLVNIQRALNNIDVHMIKENPFYFEGPLTKEFGYKSAEKMLSSAKPPTAVVISHSHTTIGFLRYCKEHSIKVPGDISFVSPCDVQLSDILYVEPTFAQPNAWVLGERCGNMLMERIKSKNQIVNRESIFMPEIRYRESVRNISNERLDK